MTYILDISTYITERGNQLEMWNTEALKKRLF